MLGNAAENPRRTQIRAKRAIYGGKLNRNQNRFQLVQVAAIKMIRTVDDYKTGVGIPYGTHLFYDIRRCDIIPASGDDKLEALHGAYGGKIHKSRRR